MFMKLPGENNAKVTIRVVRVVIVHVRTILIEIPNIDEVAIGRLLSMLSFLYFTRKLPLSLPCILLGRIYLH